MLAFLQRLLQRAFLVAERAANAIFGERLNPLYHLGALSYYLFWVVLASGLYLYAFFDTSVTEAYASVERLTHGQRWVGGILRSLHRYASDGMVLTMVLHLAAPLRLRPPPRLPLVLVGERRGRPLARVRLGHQRLHAAVGPARAVHRGRDGRVVRRAAGLQRPADPQLPQRRRRERPLLLAAVVPAHRPAARGAGAPLDPHPPRAQREDAAAARRSWRRSGVAHARAVPRETGAEPGARRTWRPSPRTSPSTGSTCRPTRSSTAGLPPRSGRWPAASRCSPSWRRGCRPSSAAARSAPSTCWPIPTTASRR